MERGPRPAKVKNKNPAPVQITAEQILRETKERQEAPMVVPKQKIADMEELNEYRQKKRKGFEDAIRKNRNHTPTWLKYAAWEESQYELDRSRSIFERAIDVDSRSQNIWIKYAEMEMKHKNVNMARNIFDRAVSILPRVDAFWYKYTYMEEMLDNVAGARQVFERWMQWEPPEEAWLAYIKLEKRYKENDRARSIFQRFVSCHPQPKNWLKWSKFEESIGKLDNAREIYEKCIETLGEEYVDQNVYISFAKFETRVKEIERARAIYQYAMDKLPKTKAENLHNVYTQFEKQYGGKDGIEDVIVTKRRVKYEEEIAANSKDYDVWFDYTRLEESAGDFDKIRDVYERAIAEVPLIKEKRFWRRYIYLWLFYAVWEEKVAKDVERAREIYKKALTLIPHKTFTFAKVWLLYAKFLIRRNDFEGFRKTLGSSIGMCPKEKLFKGYIELEMALREYDRVRKLYEKYLEWNPANCPAWIRYAELERSLFDNDRARAYIDFETGEGEWSRARELYERLLQRTEHVKVWIAYANFELINEDNGEDTQDRVPKARSIFNRAYDVLKGKGAKEERVVLLESWKQFERKVGNSASLKAVEAKMPKAVKKRRKVDGIAPGAEGAWEEYFDYLFPDDETERPNLKLFQIAHAWKEKLKAGLLDDDDDEEEEEEDEEQPSEGEEEGEQPSKGKERAGPEDQDDDGNDDRDENYSVDMEASSDVEVRGVGGQGSSSNGKRKRADEEDDD
ncbi:NineTeen Complex (NTC) component [Blyttiomyces sp. JEL0837]|nr:NineTeen Complex (NTC) component [Blyttiomyces sp. JEL0837]